MAPGDTVQKRCQKLIQMHSKTSKVDCGDCCVMKVRSWTPKCRRTRKGAVTFGFCEGRLGTCE